MNQMTNRIETLLRRIVWEETQEASTHFAKLSNDRTADIVKLILDLNEKEWSFETDAFLRELNIDPAKYWDKYGVKRKNK